MRSSTSGSVRLKARVSTQDMPKRCAGTGWPPSRAPLCAENLGSSTPTARAVPQDDAEAVRWYRLAAEQGYANAQTNLGVNTPTVKGVPRTMPMRWYRLAAGQVRAPAGRRACRNNLGVRQGEGCPGG